MARIRTIKPEFFTSEDIIELSPHARLLYIALWCEADREGRLAWKPKTFKIRYLPVDDVNIQELCEEIINRGLVELYGDGLAFIPTFLEHQHINPRETASNLPSPSDASVTRQPRVSDVQGGRKGRKDIHASVDASFEKFYEAYPKKKSRGDAEKAWVKLKPSEHLADQILQAVQRATTSEEWLKNSGQFIPYPASWLNAKGWLDGDGATSVPVWER